MVYSFSFTSVCRWLLFFFALAKQLIDWWSTISAKSHNKQCDSALNQNALFGRNLQVSRTHFALTVRCTRPLQVCPIPFACHTIFSNVTNGIRTQNDLRSFPSTYDPCLERMADASVRLVPVETDLWRSNDKMLWFFTGNIIGFSATPLPYFPSSPAT